MLSSLLLEGLCRDGVTELLELAVFVLVIFALLALSKVVQFLDGPAFCS